MSQVWSNAKRERVRVDSASDPAPAEAGLLRALLARSGVDRDRILLTQFRSTDWQSLTFTGERHEIDLRVTGVDAADVADRLVEGIEQADMPIPGHTLADIAAVRRSEPGPDGALSLHLEALTIAD